MYRSVDERSGGGRSGVAAAAADNSSGMGEGTSEKYESGRTLAMGRYGATAASVLSVRARFRWSSDIVCVDATDGSLV